MFKVNDKVKLNDTPVFDETDNNPLGLVGEIYEIDTSKSGSDAFRLFVSWSNGYNNIYRESDLELVAEQALRYNKDKPELSYILDTSLAITGACKVMSFGAVKYGRNNWKKGLPTDEVIDSLLRHLLAYKDGEVLDPESGLPHLDHVTCNALFLATFGERDDIS